MHNFGYKGDHANSIVNKYDCMNLNVITVPMVIILSYGYGINSIEQCVNWYKYQTVIILTFLAINKMFSCHLSTSNANIKIFLIYSYSNKTIEGIYAI